MLVSSSVNLAKRWKVSSLFIGLTLVSVGTSAPELFASLLASFQSVPDVALGNIVGSNIFNLLMILGLAALVKPISIPSFFLKVEWPLLSLSGFIFFFCLRDSEINRLEGLILLVSFIATVLFSFYRAKFLFQPRSDLNQLPYQKTSHLFSSKVLRKVSYKEFPPFPIPIKGFSLPILDFLRRKIVKSKIFLFHFFKKWFLLFNFGCFIGGITFLILGAHLAVKGGVQMGYLVGLSETVIGLLIISSGTGLPELVTSAIAAYKNENELAFANVIGSNLMNTLGITSFVSLLHPLSLKDPSLTKETLIMITATLGFFPLIWLGRYTISRKFGLLLLGAYGFYVWRLFD